MKRIIQGDCAEVLPTLPSSFARLIYIDPPLVEVMNKRLLSSMIEKQSNE